MKTAAQIGNPFVKNQATITLANPTTAPTERSMPAVMITNVSPIARMAVIAPCLNKLVMLFSVQKLFVLNARASHMSARSPSRVRLSSVPIRALLLTVGTRTGFDASTLICITSATQFFVLQSGLTSYADCFRQDRFRRCLFRDMARNESSPTKHVQRVTNIVDLRQIGGD